MVQRTGSSADAEGPDRPQHQLAFIVFVLVFLTIFGPADRANAATCRGPVSGVSPAAAGFGDHYVKLQTNRWCGTVAGSGARFTTGPTFGQSYADGLAWKFTKWWDAKTQTGTGTAPNGNTNVAYRARWVAAEFEACIGVGPAQLCNHRTNGVRIWAWANGQYTIRASTGRPNLPMPKP